MTQLLLVGVAAILIGGALRIARLLIWGPPGAYCVVCRRAPVVPGGDTCQRCWFETDGERG